jgi:hypothetical protein
VIKSFGISPLLQADNPQQMFGIKLLGVCCKHHSVTQLGLIEVALLMKQQGLLQ